MKISISSKFHVIMRLLLVLLITSLSLDTAKANVSQTPKISLEINDITVSDVLDQIESQSGYTFFYNNKLIDVTRKVSLSVKNDDLFHVLDMLFQGTDVKYELQEKRIILYPKENSSAQAADNTVTGTVLDASGNPVIGASVYVKGTTNGTITDQDGKFSIKVPANSIIMISSIGYLTQEINIGTRNNINVTLRDDQELLNEVVVVGYSTQRKVDLTGSVAAVDVEKLTESRPITNLSNALTGMVSGVNVTSANNKPGADDGTITVRGQGTLNNSSPLIIIDGVEAPINSVNPQDVASISVLKDAASSAIYGSRAANGVILITTKKGKSGHITVDYNGYVSFESIRKYFEPVSNYADYMELMNEGYQNSNLAPIFSQNAIDLWRNNDDPLKYPNSNWMDGLFKESTATNHVLSVSGGGDKTRVYASFGYLDNPGVMENSGQTKYSMRLNLESDVTSWLTLGTSVNGYLSDIEPGSDNVSSALNSVGPPDIVYKSPDGRFGTVNNTEDDPQQRSALGFLWNTKGSNETINARTRFYGTLKPVKGLSITGSYNFDFTDHQVEKTPVAIDYWNFLTNTIAISGKGRTWVSNSNTKTRRHFADITATYESKLFDNRFSYKIMAGASQERYQWKTFSTTRYDLIDEDLTAIDAATGEASSSGYRTEWSMRSYFGRINLNWEDRYLFEFNLRADGSSRFLKGNRWGYFPSASVGWRISEEEFMKDSGFTNLKIRASYGSLGNNSVGNYDALSLFNTANYSFNNTLAVGMAQTALANSNLTWESTYVTDLGFDFGILKNRLSGTFDFFNKKTKDILISLPAPLVHGSTSIPKQNAATVRNRGIEFSLGWNDTINDFSYSINGNFTYVKNKVLKFKGDDYSLSGANLIIEGKSINSQYLLVTDRIIQTDEDLQIVQDMLDKNPNAFAAFGVPEKGDLLYKDLNNDGVVDNNDKKIVSDGPNPKFLFGLSASASYKGFDFSILMQGQAGIKVYYQQMYYMQPTVRYGCMINKEIADGRWVEGKTNAKWPRLLEYEDTRNTQLSDFYLQNKAFLKIRNIQLGYTLPTDISSKFFVKRLRFYCSLENYFTFTDYKGIDPEVDAVNYPTIKQAVLGVNVTF